MRVTIVDLEWYNHKSFVPNPKCMKISSYYKQLNAIINFATDSYELKMDYDKMYVVRENILSGQIPEEIDLRGENVFLIGDGLKFYDRYIEEIDSVMAACRPDYSLYPIREENKMSKADIVQFFSEGKLLNKIQDYHNSYSKKHYTYIVDKNFWLRPEEDIEKCIKKLEKDNNILFSEDIDLDIIFLSKNKLNLLKKLKIDFLKQNFYITFNNEEKVDCLINLVKTFKKRAAIKITSRIEFTTDHFESPSNWIIDFYKYFSILCKLKQNNIKVRLISPERILSPYWFYFEDLESWTIYGYYESFVEFMTNYCCYKNNVDIEYLLNTTRLWNDDRIFRLMYLFRDYPDIMNNLAFIRKEKDRFSDFGIEKLAKLFLGRGDKK